MRRDERLEQDLDALERANPKIKAARIKATRDVTDEFERYERHLAARKAVGGRKMPEGEE